MGLFSYNQTVQNETVFIPENFRAFFGWHDSLQMHISSLHTPILKENLANELILTNIHLRDRLDLWTFNASFKDRKGLISKLTKIFKNLKIDIISSKVSTVDQNRYLNVEFEIDCQLYKGYFDKDTVTRKKSKFLYLDELKNYIVAEFTADLLFVSMEKKARPLIKIKRNLPLFRSYDNVNKYNEVILKKGGIMIPNDLLNEIRNNFESKYPIIKKHNGRKKLPIASVAADFESYLIRIFLFYQDTGYLHFRIKARNKVGAIAAMSEILHEGKMNINQMFNRVVKEGGFALTDFLIHHSDDLEYLTDSNLKRRLRACFNRSIHNKNYEFKVMFPKNKSYK